MLHITSSWVIYYFIAGRLYLLIFTHFRPPTLPLVPASGNQSVLCIYELGWFLFLRCEIVWYLSFSIGLISLSIMSSRSIHIVKNSTILFFLWLNNILLYLCVIFSFFIHLLMKTVVFHIGWQEYIITHYGQVANGHFQNLFFNFCINF